MSKHQLGKPNRKWLWGSIAGQTIATIAISLTSLIASAYLGLLSVESQSQLLIRATTTAEFLQTKMALLDQTQVALTTPKKTVVLLLTRTLTQSPTATNTPTTSPTATTTATPTGTPLDIATPRPNATTRAPTSTPTPSPTTQMFETEIAALQNQIATLQYTVSQEAQKQDYGAEVASLSDGQINLDERLAAIEQAVLDNPAKSLELTLMRNEIDSIKDTQQSDAERTLKEIERLYDQNKWFIGLMFTMATGILSLAIANFIKKPEKPERRESYNPRGRPE